MRLAEDEIHIGGLVDCNRTYVHVAHSGLLTKVRIFTIQNQANRPKMLEYRSDTPDIRFTVALIWEISYLKIVNKQYAVFAPREPFVVL